MPRIDADTVAEHVAHQEAAVVAAAARLFCERGVANVTLGDIAAEVGLKRNSLYRYFLGKEHLLAAWFRTELSPLREQSEQIARADAPRAERLRRWLDLNLDYLTAPEHQAMVTAFTGSTSVSDEVRTDIGRGHHELYSTLADILCEPGDGAGDQRTAIGAVLLSGALRSAAETVIAGADRRLVRDELVRLANALLAT